MCNVSSYTVHQAKRIVRAFLDEHNLDNKLSARTVDFSDLARGTCVFVMVHNWTPSPIADELRSFAIKYGFRVEFSGPGVVR